MSRAVRTPGGKYAALAGRARRSGALFLETCLAIMLMGTVLAMVSLLMARYARATDHMINHRRAQLAAEAVVERMRAGLVPVADGTLPEEDGITVSIELGDGDDGWAPLNLVRVTAVAPCKHGRTAQYRLSAYVVAEPPTDGGLP